MIDKIRLFWWSEKYFHNSDYENYGDLLGKYLVEKISNKDVVFSDPKKRSFKNLFQPIYVTIGSILTNVNTKCIVWGSGIISREYVIKKAKFLAVRGPQTRNHLIKQGFDVPAVYGDPALLLPDFFNPVVDKQFKLGIVPHVLDYKAIKELYKNNKNILVINLHTNDIEVTTKQFLKCEKIISSSLHGIIVSHAYGIPAVWQQFSDKLFGDGVKFQDYFESVGIAFYRPEICQNSNLEKDAKGFFLKYDSLPDTKIIEDLKKGLLACSPF